MTGSLLLFTSLLAAGPAVSAVTLDETTLEGTLTGLEGDSARLMSPEGDARNLALSDLRFLRFPEVEPPSPFDDPPAVEVTLADGSRLACASITVSRQSARLATEDFGELSVPIARIRSVRLGDVEKVGDRWRELQERENLADLLVVRKGDLLDFVEGSVGEITDENVAFLLGDRSVTVPRDRAFGVVYAVRPALPGRAAAQLHAGRNLLQAASLTFDGGGFAVELPAGVAARAPVEKVHLIEFAGRVRYLHEMEAAVEYPSGISELDRIWHFRRGTASNGAPLKVGAGEIMTTRGLWMHSGVTARYRINRDYRRLTGLVGMDHNVGGNKSVRVVILGDARPLFDQTVAWSEKAREIDLDVSGVRDLEIRVERLPEIAAQDIFGIQEHLALGNIRLIR